MSYNTRRGGGGPGRNPGNNFVPRGQLAAQNRPPVNQGARQQFSDQSNGNFRQGVPPPVKMPPPQQQQRPSQQQQRPPQQQQRPPQQQRLPQQQQRSSPQQQPTPQQQPAPQQQQQPTPQQQPMPTPIQADPYVKEESELGDDTPKKKFWFNKTKISKKERQRRRNLRLSKMLQPKNAVMILNELVKNATYTVTDIPQPGDVNQYTASVQVEDVNHIGMGRSKMEAKNNAAENALKFIVKNRQFTTLRKDEDGDEKMETEDESTPTLPWQHVASFALFKLLNSWGEDPNQAGKLSGAQSPEAAAATPQTNKPAKKLPDNAAHMNPLMLMNQMLPQAQFEECGRVGLPPNITFSFNCNVDGQTFMGSGPNKKEAKKMAAFAVCTQILKIQYPPEVYTPVAPPAPAN